MFFLFFRNVRSKIVERKRTPDSLESKERRRKKERNIPRFKEILSLKEAKIAIRPKNGNRRSCKFAAYTTVSTFPGWIKNTIERTSEICFEKNLAKRIKSKKEIIMCRMS